MTSRSLVRSAPSPTSLSTSTASVCDFTYQALRLNLDCADLYVFSGMVKRRMDKYGIKIKLNGPEPQLVKGNLEDLKIGGRLWTDLNGWPREQLLLRDEEKRHQSNACHMSLRLLCGLIYWRRSAKREVSRAKAENRLPIAVLPGCTCRIPETGILLPFCQSSEATEILLEGIKRMTSMERKRRKSWDRILVGRIKASPKLRDDSTLREMTLRIMPTTSGADCQQRCLLFFHLTRDPPSSGVRGTVDYQLKQTKKPKYGSLFGGTLTLKASRWAPAVVAAYARAYPGRSLPDGTLFVIRFASELTNTRRQQNSTKVGRAQRPGGVVEPAEEKTRPGHSQGWVEQQETRPSAQDQGFQVTSPDSVVLSALSPRSIHELRTYALSTM